MAPKIIHSDLACSSSAVDSGLGVLPGPSLTSIPLASPVAERDTEEDVALEVLM